MNADVVAFIELLFFFKCVGDAVVCGADGRADETSLEPDFHPCVEIDFR